MAVAFDTYDAEGNRIRKHTAEGDFEYLWSNDQLLAERTPDGIWTDNVYVDGGRFASVRKVDAKANSPVEVAYFVTGGIGTSRLKLSGEGAVLARGTFGPFGIPATPASEAAADISFSDEVHDRETGLDTYKFRSYNRRLGRWMSPDPSSLHFASLGNPQTYNLYAFVTNDPLKYIDVHGLWSYCGEYDEGDAANDGCASGGGGDGDPPGGDDPPPPDDPCQYDACVVANPDPPIDPDPVPPFDPSDYCNDGVCFGNPYGPYDASPTVADDGTAYNTSKQMCVSGSCNITVYYGDNSFGNVCSTLHGTNGAAASVYSLWDCQGTLADCQKNQPQFRDSCYAQGQTPLDPQYGFGGQGSGGSFYDQACCSVPKKEAQ